MNFFSRSLLIGSIFLSANLAYSSTCFNIVAISLAKSQTFPKFEELFEELALGPLYEVGPRPSNYSFYSNEKGKTLILANTSDSGSYFESRDTLNELMKSIEKAGGVEDVFETNIRGKSESAVSSIECNEAACAASITATAIIPALSLFLPGADLQTLGGLGAYYIAFFPVLVHALNSHYSAKLEALKNRVATGTTGVSKSEATTQLRKILSIEATQSQNNVIFISSLSSDSQNSTYGVRLSKEPDEVLAELGFVKISPSRAANELITNLNSRDIY